MLHLLLGRAGAGKSASILGRIARSGGARRQLLIVPEQASHETERRLCAVAGNQVSLYAEVLSFTRLSSRVFALSGGLAAPALDAGGRLLLMYAALKAVSDKLTVYARPSKKPSFLTGLLATLDECKQYQVSPDDLARTGGELEGREGDKLRDLGLIFGAYDALTARTAADPRDRLTRLAQGLRECRYAQGMDVYVDGFTDFTPPGGPGPPGSDGPGGVGHRVPHLWGPGRGGGHLRSRPPDRGRASAVGQGRTGPGGGGAPLAPKGMEGEIPCQAGAGALL